MDTGNSIKEFWTFIAKESKNVAVFLTAVLQYVSVHWPFCNAAGKENQ